jgi:hypothetical protein
MLGAGQTLSYRRCHPNVIIYPRNILDHAWSGIFAIPILVLPNIKK